MLAGPPGLHYMLRPDFSTFSLARYQEGGGVLPPTSSVQTKHLKHSSDAEMAGFTARATWCIWKEEFIDLGFVRTWRSTRSAIACSRESLSLCITEAEQKRRGYLSVCWWVETPTVQCGCKLPICPPDSALLQTARTPLLCLMELEQSRENRTPHSALCLGSSVGQW